MSNRPTIAEPQMNATPLIDVLLVLLVMLIFTVPVATHSVLLNLPHGPPRGAVPEVVRVDIAFDGAVSLNGAPVESLAVLEKRLAAYAARNPAPIVQVRPDPFGRYENAAQVLAAAQRAHVSRLAVASVRDR